MSLREHTKIKIAGAGKLTKIGQTIAGALNELADDEAHGRLLANHRPASPRFWFHGLAQEHAMPFGQFASDPPLSLPVLRKALSDEAIVLARAVLACHCQATIDEHADEIAPEDICYACAFDGHRVCRHGCTANPDVIEALDAELRERGIEDAAEIDRAWREAELVPWAAAALQELYFPTPPEPEVVGLA